MISRMPRHAVLRLLLALVLAHGVCALAWAQPPAAAVAETDWQTTAVCPGVTLKHRAFDSLFGSKQRVWVATVDMSSGRYGIAFPYSSPQRKPVSQFAREIPKAVAVVNANFFDMQSGAMSQHLKVGGVVVAETQPQVADEGGILADTTGRSVRLVSRQECGDDWYNVSEPNVMATNLPLVLDGAPYPYPPGDPFYHKQRHPRTGVGITTGSLLLLVAVEGRLPAADGMTMVEFQSFLQAMGAWDAVNMDGGGSTALWVKGQPGSGIVNRPSGGSERPVATAIAVVEHPDAGPAH